ncbi:MAG: mutY [Phycisphaerales bacterium]|nr:mutY [Phycisphaerales bacterium]
MHRNDVTFPARLLSWYDRVRRDLPWRVPAGRSGAPHPYHVLVSELMLQQTQVAIVVPYFHRFLARFPTLADLAAADEQDVLRLWQGLGYYSRARNLHRAAKRVVAEHGGHVPAGMEQLLDLPGVGRYTAGAVASIAFGVQAPILDGNVTRVLCRLDGITDDPRDREVQTRLWTRAEEILPPIRVGDFNSALMELGATVCTPRSPKCLLCPVATACVAQARGIQEDIPPPKKAKPTPLERRVVLCVARGDHWLIEQRPATGRWAGMWQFVTRPEPAGADPVPPPVPVGPATRIGRVEHQLTHRRYTFDVTCCRSTDDSPAAIAGPHAWVTLEGLKDYPLPKPHVKVASLLRTRALEQAPPS